jgi:hypothetical protein
MIPKHFFIYRDSTHSRRVINMRLIPILAILVLIAPALGAVPQLTEDEKELAITSIEGYTEVQDAAITQDGDQLSLALIVGYSTNEETAKDLGDSFVRLVKTFGPEEAPGKEIGPGLYYYLIGVYYPDGSLVAMGAKCPSCSKITW